MEPPEEEKDHISRQVSSKKKCVILTIKLIRSSFEKIIFILQLTTCVINITEQNLKQFNSWRFFLVKISPIET